MTPTTLCDNCGNETSEEFGHPTESKSLCFKCYEEAFYQYEVNQGKEWLKKHLPTMAVFFRIYREKVLKGKQAEVKCLAGNCHAAAVALHKLLKEKKIETKVKRGMWVGGDVREKLRRSFQQHSWLSIRVPKCGMLFYLDPTQWVFTGAVPEIAISDQDDNRYDSGGHQVREALRVKIRGILGCSPIPERKGKLQKSGLSDSAQKRIAAIFGKRNWSQWCLDEVFEIANAKPERYGPHAREIFEAIDKCGHKACIPLLSWEEVFNEGHHP